MSKPGTSAGNTEVLYFRQTIADNPKKKYTSGVFKEADPAEERALNWGVAMFNAVTGNLETIGGRRSWGTTLAHEIGHVLSLYHRGGPLGDDSGDGLTGNAFNLMGRGTPEGGEDLDMIQAVIMRKSDVFAG